MNKKKMKRNKILIEFGKQNNLKTREKKMVLHFMQQQRV